MYLENYLGTFKKMVVKIERKSKTTYNTRISHKKVDEKVKTVAKPKKVSKVKKSSCNNVKTTVKTSTKVSPKAKVKQKAVTSKLQFNKSTVINNIELREKISKLASIDNKGLKYLSFQEFEHAKDIHSNILNLISKSKKISIITGAGISCNAGIPDFRSDTGLYNKKLKEKENRTVIKGKEMFDISVYKSVETINIFNNFIFALYQQVSNSKPTSTHEFIKKLNDKGKLLKCYTQNIDGLERDCGLRAEFNCEEWNDTNVIQLHGDLHQLCCNSCKHPYRWDEIYTEEGNIKCKVRDFNPVEEIDDEELISEEENSDDLMLLSQHTVTSVESLNSTFSVNGIDSDSASSICELSSKMVTDGYPEDNFANLIECPRCIENYESRIKLGKRSLESSIGIIRPNIVLYGEEHPYSEKFAKNLNKDLNKKPNMLLIFGTSLKVAGVKNLVKKMSKKIHENDKGLVILINKDPVSYSFWKNYIDYQIVSDCDAFCNFVENKLPSIFS